MDNSNQEWPRRTFISTLTGKSAVIMLHLSLSRMIHDVDARVAAIVAKTMGRK